MVNNEIGNYIKMEEIVDLDETVEYVSSILLNDGVVLIPTDTVYGLICRPDSIDAIKMIFKMKQRPMTFNLPIIVADKEQAQNELPTKWIPEADILASNFWPGALTIACGIRENNIPWLKGRVEVGIRVPDFPLIQKMAKKLGPLFMTSANLHGVETSHTVQGAWRSLAFKPALTIDGGELSGAPSTLVNVNLPKPVVERNGSIPKEEIERILYER